MKIIEPCLVANASNVSFVVLQPPKKDTKGSSKQPQKTQKKKEGGSGGKAKKKVYRYTFFFPVPRTMTAMDNSMSFISDDV